MSTSENNKRIAKNTLFLYFRQILVMAVSLYTVRVVLAALGVEDYGIYNVVGGFVSMFNILSGALSVAISRFITFEMGRNGDDIRRMQQIFSSSVIIQVVMGLLVSLLIATFGVWFVENKMVIPEERLHAAVVVLFFSTASFFINLLSVPYNALIIAHEQMKAFAYISIVEAGLNLLMAYLLIVASCDKLLLYAFCMVVVALIVRTTYALYCKRHFSECHFVKGFDKRLLSRMFTFAGWAFLGNGSFVLKEHGVNLLLNLFCGPAVNAARGITSQVTRAVTLFISNFMQAVNPQITKSYSSGNLDEMHRLIFTSSRFSFYLMLLLSLPLMKSVDYALGLWLVDVPEYTGLFICLLLIFCLMDCLVQPLMTGLLAEGNIRTYEIALVILNSCNVILSYFALREGFAPESVYVVSIVVEIGIMWSRIYLSGKAYALPTRRYCLEVIGKAGVTALVSGIFTWWLNFSLSNDFIKFVIVTFFVMLFTCLIVGVIGLDSYERTYLLSVIRNKYKNNLNANGNIKE